MELFSKTLKNYDKYKVLNLNHIPLEIQRMRFGWTCEITNLMVCSEKYNKLMEEDKIDYSVLYNVLEAIVKGRILNDKELEKYFTFSFKLMKFTDRMIDIESIYHNIPSEMECFLLGVPLVAFEYAETSETCWKYNLEHDSFLIGDIDYNSFILAAKAVTNDVVRVLVRKEALKEGQSLAGSLN